MIAGMAKSKIILL